MPFSRNKPRLRHGHGVSGSADMTGFTLIELLVAVVVVGILSSIAYPSYVESVRRAKRGEGKAALLQALQAQERYYSQQNSYVAYSASAPKGFKTHSGDSLAGSLYDMSADACAGEVIRDCVTVTAKPKFDDPTCGSLAQSSNGLRTPTDPVCWR